MRLIWALPHVASLNVFDLQYNAVSCRWEDWSRGPYWKPATKDSSYCRLQEYACRRGPYPFPKLARLLRYRHTVAALGLSMIELSIPSQPIPEELLAPHHDNSHVSEVLDAERSTLGMRAGLISQEEKWELLKKCSDYSWEWSAPEKDCTFDVSSDEELEDDTDDFGLDDFGGDSDDSVDDFLAGVGVV